MRAFLLWIRAWFKLTFTLRKIAHSERLLVLLDSKQVNAEKRMIKREKQLKGSVKRYERIREKCERKLERGERRVVSISEAATEDMDEFRSIIQQLKEAIEAQREELQILKEVTVPMLTEEIRLYQERWRALISKEVRKQVGNSPNQDFEQ